MGRLGAESMAGQDISLETALSWHLQSNHYPPVPSSMIPVCVEAIEKAAAGDYNDAVELPGPISYKGSSEAPVWAVVEAHHLEPWIETEEEEFE